MNDGPSEPLIELLARLRLATPGQVQSQAAQVRRLAGDLPPLDTVWVDALAQARLLTPFQAAQINAGRGDQLAIGPYVLVRPLGALGFADCFEGRHLQLQTSARVYLLGRAYRETKVLLAELEQLTTRSARVATPGLLTLEVAGDDQGRLWAASSHEPDPTHHGIAGATAALDPSSGSFGRRVDDRQRPFPTFRGAALGSEDGGGFGRGGIRRPGPWRPAGGIAHVPRRWRCVFGPSRSAVYCPTGRRLRVGRSRPGRVRDLGPGTHCRRLAPDHRQRHLRLWLPVVATAGRAFAIGWRQ